MKDKTISKEFEFLGEYYKVTRYIGSEVMEIAKLEPNGFWGKHGKIYKRFYFGHLNPLEESIKFFKDSQR